MVSLTASSMPTAGTSSAQMSVAVVDHHPVVALGVERCLASAPDLSVVGGYASVRELLASRGVEHPADVVVAELTPPDGTSPQSNLSTLAETGARVVAFTAERSPYLLDLALAAGALAVVHKTVPPEVLVRAVRAAARGQHQGVVPGSLAQAGWSAPLLSPRERQTLELYAAGEKSERVAQRLGISRETVNDYVGRIRGKYRMAGRPADTKVDLYKRAVEDGILPPPGENVG